MPVPKKLSRIGAQYVQILAAATQKKVRLEFPPEDYGKWKNVTMQLNNAIALFKAAKPGDCPEEWAELRGPASGLATQLSKDEGFLEVGPANEVGIGARIAEAMRHAGVKPDLRLMTSAKSIANAHEAVRRLEEREAPPMSATEIDALLEKHPVMPPAAPGPQVQRPPEGEIPNDLGALAKAMKDD